MISQESIKLFVRKAGEALTSCIEMKKIHQNIEFWENDTLNLRLYFMFMFRKNSNYRCVVLLTTMKLFKA